MNRCFIVSALLVAACASPALAQKGAFISDSTAPTNTVTVQRGDTFPIILRLDTEDTWTGFNYFLEEQGFAGTSHFSITGRTSSGGNPMPTPNTADAALVGDPIDDQTLDLGYHGATAPFGQYSVETVNLIVLPTTPNGTYTLHADPATTYSPSGGTLDAYGTYTVVVVPEPATLAMLALAGIAVARRRRFD